MAREATATKQKREIIYPVGEGDLVGIGREKYVTSEGTDTLPRGIPHVRLYFLRVNHIDILHDTPVMGAKDEVLKASYLKGPFYTAEELEAEKEEIRDISHKTTSRVIEKAVPESKLEELTFDKYTRRDVVFDLSPPPSYVFDRFVDKLRELAKQTYLKLKEQEGEKRFLIGDEKDKAQDDEYVPGVVSLIALIDECFIGYSHTDGPFLTYRIRTFSPHTKNPLSELGINKAVTDLGLIGQEIDAATVTEVHYGEYISLRPLDLESFLEHKSLEEALKANAELLVEGPRRNLSSWV